MESVVHFLQDRQFGKKQYQRNLTLFPVLFTEIVKPDQLALEQAINIGLLVVNGFNYVSDNVKRLDKLN